MEMRRRVVAGLPMTENPNAPFLIIPDERRRVKQAPVRCPGCIGVARLDAPFARVVG